MMRIKIRDLNEDRDDWIKEALVEDMPLSQEEAVFGYENEASNEALRLREYAEATIYPHVESRADLEGYVDVLVTMPADEPDEEFEFYFKNGKVV